MVSQCFIKLDDFTVTAADKNIQLGAAHRHQQLLYHLHDLLAIALPLIVWMHTQIIHRATMTILARHGRGNYFSFNLANQKQFRLY